MAGGYGVTGADTVKGTSDELDKEMGREFLRSVQANDARRDLGCSVGRHENVGEGFIGDAGFATLLSHQAFKDIPFYLEVPGTNKSGPDRPNLDVLKQIRTQVGAG